MALNIDFVTAVIASAILVFTGLISLIRLKKFSTYAVFNLLFYLSALSLLIFEFLCLSNKLSYFKFMDFLSITLTLKNSLLIAVMGILIIREQTPKKMKTLWRVPIIGFLLGYMGGEYLVVVNLGLYAVTLFLFFMNRKDLRMLFPYIIMLGVVFIGFYFVRNHNFWYLNTVLIFYYLITFRLWNFGQVKTLFWENRV